MYQITNNLSGLTIDKSEASEGETVTVTVNKKILYPVYYYWNDGSESALLFSSSNAGNTYSFTMPASRVSIGGSEGSVE